MKRFRELFESPPGLTEPGEQTFTKSEHGPKKKKISEQHREEGRFKPTIPRYVKSKGVGPRPTIDSVKVKLREDIDIPKDAPSVESIAKKHGVSVEHIKKQLEMGMKVEAEHGKNKGSEREIALDHLNEKPDYYTKLKKYVEGVEPDMESIAARTYNEKPQKEPMKTLKQFHKEEVDTPPMHVRSMYTRHYAKHGGTISTAKTASAKAYDAVEKMHGKEMRNKLEAFHRRNMNEEVEQIDEGRPSQQHPLEGHEYHKKTDAELIHIAKDAHKAAEAMKGHNTQAENKYRDQANDSATVRYFRQKSGMPDWYKKKYGHVKEEVEQIDEMDKSQPSSDRGGESSGNPWEKGSKATPITAKKVKKDFLSVLSKSIDKSNKAKQDTATNMAKHKMKEEVEQIDEVSDTTLSSYTQKAKKSADELESQKQYGKALKRRVGVLSAVSKMTGRAGEKIGQLAKEEKDVPFEGGTTKPKEKVIPGKLGKGYSTARHLARQALKKQVEKMKPMKESLEESRKAEIVKEIAKKKKNETSTESENKFQKEPMLSGEITKI